ncbi:MAG: hypothetical protein ABWW69_04395 [Pyrodictiaceae archaeon]
MAIKGLPKFRCLGCAYCCFFSEEWESPVIFPWEKRILEELGAWYGAQLEFKPLEIFGDEEGKCVAVVYKWVIKGFCPFYSILSRSCKIHEYKPLACKMYPLLINLSSAEIIASAKCKWVKERSSAIRLLGREELLRHVLPKEYRALRQAFMIYTTLVESLNRRGFYRINDPSHCASMIELEDALKGAGHGREA